MISASVREERREEERDERGGGQVDKRTHDMCGGLLALDVADAVAPDQRLPRDAHEVLRPEEKAPLWDVEPPGDRPAVKRFNRQQVSGVETLGKCDGVDGRRRRRRQWRSITLSSSGPLNSTSVGELLRSGVEPREESEREGEWREREWRERERGEREKGRECEGGRKGETTSLRRYQLQRMCSWCTVTSPATPFYL